MSPKTCKQLFKRFYKHNSTPTTELIFNSPFELLIAVMLSAQATDKSVNKATKPLFETANTPQQIQLLGESELKNFIKTINYYPTKAKHIIQTCDLLIEKYNSNVPENRKALESLPGVGRKTANVILNTAFGQATLAVDTHIFRVAHRLGLSKGKTPLAVEKDLIHSIPKQYLKDAHHWLILHGRYICKAKNPACSQCFINDLCEYPDKSIQ